MVGGNNIINMKNVNKVHRHNSVREDTMTRETSEEAGGKGTLKSETQISNNSIKTDLEFAVPLTGQNSNSEIQNNQKNNSKLIDHFGSPKKIPVQIAISKGFELRKEATKQLFGVQELYGSTLDSSDACNHTFFRLKQRLQILLKNYMRRLNSVKEASEG